MEKTYFNRLRQLNREYEPEQRGIVKINEIRQIEKVLGLDEMSEMELRNMRDMTAMYYDIIIDETEKKLESEGGSWKSMMALMDKVSAITAVIDNSLVAHGYAV